MTPKCPSNYILVKIDQKYKESIETESGLQFFVDTTFRPEWHTTIVGEVVSLPNVITPKGWPRRKKIVCDIEPGDEIVFSYLVVFDMMHSGDNDDLFSESYDTGSPYIQEFTNRDGDRIVTRYRIEDGLFDCAAMNEKVGVYDMAKKLTLDQKITWLAKYKFSEVNKITYNNLIEVDGEEYWKVDVGYVIARRRKGGAIIPIGGHVIIDQPIKREEEYEGKIHLLNPIKKVKQIDQEEGLILAIGEPLQGDKDLGLVPGDVAVFQSKYAENYNIYGRDVLVLKQERILLKSEV